MIDDDGPTLEQHYDQLMMYPDGPDDAGLRAALNLGVAACTSESPTVVNALLQEALDRCPSSVRTTMSRRLATWAVHNDRPQALRTLLDHHGLTLHDETLDHEPLFALIDRHPSEGLMRLVRERGITSHHRWEPDPQSRIRRPVGGPVNRVSWMLLHTPPEDVVAPVLALLDTPEVQGDPDLLDHALRCLPDCWNGRMHLHQPLTAVMERLLDLGARFTPVWRDPPPRDAHLEASAFDPSRPGVEVELWHLSGNADEDREALGEHGRFAVQDPDFVESRWHRPALPVAHRDERAWSTAHAMAEAFGSILLSEEAADLARRVDVTGVAPDAFGRSPLAVMVYTLRQRSLGMAHDHPGLQQRSSAPRDDDPYQPPADGPSHPTYRGIAALARQGWAAGYVGWEPLRMGWTLGVENGNWNVLDALLDHAPAPDARLEPQDLLGMAQQWVQALHRRGNRYDVDAEFGFSFLEVLSADAQRFRALGAWTSDAGRPLINDWADRIDQVVSPAVRTFCRAVTGTMGMTARPAEAWQAALDGAIGPLRERLALEDTALRAWDGQTRAVRPRL